MKKLLIGALSLFTLVSASCGSNAQAEDDGPGVEGWFFRAVGGYPGSVEFEPIVLFENGDYFEVGEEPIESLDVESSKEERPSAWGRWTKTGLVYNLTNHKDRTTEYKLGSGSWFPAYPYKSSTKLKELYKNASGGTVGEATSLVMTTIRFYDDGTFQQGHKAGVISPNSAGGNKRKASGTYEISGHTLELTYDNGKVVKKSFALGASGKPAKPSTNMIFIGGDAFVDD